MFAVGPMAMAGWQLANQAVVQQSPVAWNPQQFVRPTLPTFNPFVQAFPSPPAAPPTTPERPTANTAATPTDLFGTPTSTLHPGTPESPCDGITQSPINPNSPPTNNGNSPPPPPPAPPRTATVNDEGLALRPQNGSQPARPSTAALTNFVLSRNLSTKPENTVKAFNPKIQEFFGHCEHLYAEDPSTMHHLTRDKVYKFMFHQCFREKKPRGGKKNERGTSGEFDRVSHNKVMSHFDDRFKDGTSTAFPEPANPIGISACTQFIACFRLLHKKEDADGTTKLRWEEIIKMGFDHLKEHVKSRSAARKKANYAEKGNNEFAPHQMADGCNEIEDEMWSDCQKSHGRRQACTQLKHRHCMNHLKGAPLRSESLFQADMSDFFGVKAPKKDSDIHQMFVMCNQFAGGKTNHGRILWGRGTRHRDVRVCPIGSSSFHFTCRFDVADEFADMTAEDWMNNRSWFDIKLLIDASNPDNTQPIKNDSFSQHIGNALERLGLPADKKLHLGRNIGAKICDMAELSAEDIRRIGNWNPSICDESYSSKIPIAAIRSCAGYEGKICFNPRSDVTAPDGPLKAMPIGKWACRAHKALLESDGGHEHATAIQFLEFMQETNKIAVQDAAAIAVLHPDRCKNHPFFNDVEALKSPEFEACVETVRRSLASVEDPCDASLNEVIPGVQRFHQGHHQDMHILKEGIQALQVSLNGVSEKIDASAAARDRKLASSFLEAANVLLGGKEVEEDIERMLGIETAVPLTERMEVDEAIPVQIGAPKAAGATSPGLNCQAPTANRMDRGGPPPAESMDFTKVRMCAKHHTLSSLCDEWHGRGKYEGNGLTQLDQRFGDKWRKHFKGSEKQNHSKVSRIVEAIEKQATQKGIAVEESCCQLEEMYVTARTGITKMVALLKDAGWIIAKKTRGRKTVSELASS